MSKVNVALLHQWRIPIEMMYIYSNVWLSNFLSFILHIMLTNLVYNFLLFFFFCVVHYDGYDSYDSPEDYIINIKNWIVTIA